MAWKFLQRGLSNTILLVVCLGGVSLALSRPQPNCTNCHKSALSQSSNPLLIPQLQQLAQTITVKVLSKELLGSGTLIKNEGQVYTVITNAHVLRAAKPPYRIQTPNGRVYSATVSQNVQFQNDDLAVLQFRSPDVVYRVATVGDSSNLKVGEQVFVCGFTSNLSSGQSQREKKDKFVFTPGKISLLLEKPLEQGYQIGYTNDVRKGMSGGPLLNNKGEVVGINSLHKDPVWNTPEVYQDGSQPEARLQELITQSSMAVPIRKELLQNHQENQS
ncbi:serine protease [Aetokthonos hydrillicola Thurmond2011]|jgi:S1-C subfamily serine protease|uniref:Serine protease n=1 Tax=Aetokthonos hydrillicola Thurmond2011 TaxID=2712845 RepID=A0AAP5I6J5_9CYAN|nr:serine protease [Aetokthonos hydrillicola]MBO3460981.1 trypsin-like peptidase domain-containing protein [Aetokthonos hydrillicola CCALA 1050]MBW4583655.1 serine protease [Aetokthonos hydrillicola CCALA 1050]MDR9895649.1 serine protease [Aetokthonos hydrillicola Thurmond2011]